MLFKYLIIRQPALVFFFDPQRLNNNTPLEDILIIVSRNKNKIVNTVKINLLFCHNWKTYTN